MKRPPEVLVDAMKLEIYLERGIVPMGDGTHKDIDRALAQLPPAEARRLKRKFRKEWRKVARKSARITQHKLSHMGLDLGAKPPSKRARGKRKLIVAVDVSMEAQRRAAAVVGGTDE